MDVIKAGARPLCPEEVCVGTPIVLASDNAGYELKHYVEQYLDACGVEWIDCNPEEGVAKHYPEWAHKAAQTIMEGKAKSGILICGTGIGIGIAAMKCPGIYTDRCDDAVTARLARQQLDVNMLSVSVSASPASASRWRWSMNSFARLLTRPTAKTCGGSKRRKNSFSRRRSDDENCDRFG